MTESTSNWFSVREKYYLLADKLRFISQIRAAEQTDVGWPSSTLAIILGKTSSVVHIKEYTLHLYDYSMNAQTLLNGVSIKR